MYIGDMTRADMIAKLNAYCERRMYCVNDPQGFNDCPFYGKDNQNDFEHMSDDQLVECLGKIGIHVKPDNDIVAEEKIEQAINEIKPDMVAHPPHYNQGGIECIDAIKSATVGKTGIEAVCVANVIKYCWRYEEKNGVDDVKKSRWYLDRLIKELEAKA